MKISSLFSIVCSLIASNLNLKAQVRTINLEKKFDFAVEISSIVVEKNSIYLIQEKCKQILIVNKKSDTVLNTINLDKDILKGKPVEIEGAFLYKTNILLTDERNAKIYNYNLLDSSISEVKTDFDLSNDTGSYGMEGITGDTTNKICYLLKEKNGNSQSVIHVFQVIDSPSITLKFLEDAFIEQTDNSWRYSDLCYNYRNQYLYLLKSKWDFYQVDTLVTSFNKSSGHVIIANSKSKRYLDISAEVNKCASSGYNTNMEGIAIDEDRFYLVSDNAQETYANCDALGQGKTLLMSIELYPIKVF